MALSKLPDLSATNSSSNRLLPRRLLFSNDKPSCGNLIFSAVRPWSRRCRAAMAEGFGSRFGVQHLHESNLLECAWCSQTTGSPTIGMPHSMNEKYFQAFALAYMIGWFLARLPKRK